MSTINGKACVANGRNLLLDTGFNNLPQYWTSRAGTVNGTFNGHNVIYYDATTITGNFTNVLQQPIYDPALTTNRVSPSQWYTLSFYAKGVGQMTSYVYSSFVDTGAGSYIDGVALGYANFDGSNHWDLTDTWVRHTYTFKSRASFLDMGRQNVLWRLYPGNEAYICMPKLETGTLATSLTPVPVDKVFSNGRQVYWRNYFSVSGFTANKYTAASIDYYHLQLLPNTKYTVSTNNAGIVDQGYANVFVGNKGFTPSTPVNGVIVNKPQTVTTDSTGILTIAARNYSLADGKDKIQVELGAVETAWTPAPEDI